MRRVLSCVLIFMITGLAGCQKDKPNPDPSGQTYKVTSPEFIDNLLLVNRNDFKIATDKPAEFASTSPYIDISADGTIKRLTSGEVAAIDITWTDEPSKKTKIYAVGATDTNHDAPYKSFHGKLATDPYGSYKHGWATLKSLPTSGLTYAIILRHADADDGKDYTAVNTGNGPANWWKSCDPSLARQLNARGKARSAELGTIFKDLNYPFARVISSEFCRSVTTAELIDVAPSGDNIILDERINHPEHNTTGNGLFNGMIDVLKELPVDNKMTLMVTHHPINETSSQGYPSFPLCSPFTWTGGYIVTISPDKTITYQGAVSYAMFEYWRNLKLKRL